MAICEKGRGFSFVGCPFNVIEATAMIGYIEALRGKTAQARRTLDELRELAAQRYVQPYNMALVYAGLGDNQRTFEWLEKAYDDRDYGVFYTINDPTMSAALKKTPAWHALMRRPAFQEIARVRAQILAHDRSH